MKRGEILDAVKNTITKDRNDRHGEPENSFPRIAEAWSDYLKRLGWVEPKLKPSDVAEMLAIFKTCRFETQPDNPDNEHDRIGYYAIAAELRARERMEGLDWIKLKPIGPEIEPASAARELINGGPPPAPNGPNRKPQFEGDTFAGKLITGLAVEWTGVANMHGELLWHRTK